MEHETQNCAILRFDFSSSRWLDPIPVSAKYCGAAFPSAVLNNDSIFNFG